MSYVIAVYFHLQLTRTAQSSDVSDVLVQNFNGFQSIKKFIELIF